MPVTFRRTVPAASLNVAEMPESASTHTRLSVLGLVLAFVAATGITTCMTLVYQGMASIMVTSGGFVATGGPYVIAHQAPNWVSMMPLAIIGMLVFWGVSSVASSRGWGIALGLVMWSALFIALGWNFLRFGANPPAGMQGAWAWTMCGVIFWVMGFGPLLLLLPFARGWWEGLLAAQKSDAQRFWKLPRTSETSKGYVVAQALGAAVGIMAGIVLFATIAG